MFSGAAQTSKWSRYRCLHPNRPFTGIKWAGGKPNLRHRGPSRPFTLSKFQMQINVFTFFVVLYASTQIKATTFFCRCVTNGVVSADSTQACCGSGGIFGTEDGEPTCLVGMTTVNNYAPCCATHNQGSGCSPII
ncbi:hypothetical protein B0H13DRAFT_2393834 [Mycena leptocephala]|nr:hypothetical protein B0H13DRAFT_2393834 [Mycena leptocephala]